MSQGYKASPLPDWVLKAYGETQWRSRPLTLGEFSDAMLRLTRRLDAIQKLLTTPPAAQGATPESKEE